MKRKCQLRSSVLGDSRAAVPDAEVPWTCLNLMPGTVVHVGPSCCRSPTTAIVGAIPPGQQPLLQNEDDGESASKRTGAAVT
mmetsp:Transcript_87612/g.168029  ORF Transcript_87612/g.168029 Transcript_87612/m.168029 type:complete len:82 (+) Transcript_87612:49-294(+)